MTAREWWVWALRFGAITALINAGQAVSHWRGLGEYAAWFGFGVVTALVLDADRWSHPQKRRKP